MTDRTESTDSNSSVCGLWSTNKHDCMDDMLINTSVSI